MYYAKEKQAQLFCALTFLALLSLAAKLKQTGVDLLQVQKGFYCLQFHSLGQLRRNFARINNYINNTKQLIIMQTNSGLKLHFLSNVSKLHAFY